MKPEAVVRFDNLWAGFRRGDGIHYVFRGANLDIRPGDLVCLIGPSGSGKTVLLNLLIGTLKANRRNFVLRGGLEVMGEDITKRYPDRLADHIGIVFQESALFEDFSCRENVAFGLRRRGLGWRETAQKVKELLAAVDLHDIPSRTGELSGGQKKRLALARTLAKEPEFLIFDEPTTGLDPQLSRQIGELIRRTHDENQGRRTTLVVTHDYETIVPLATRVFLIHPDRGIIEAIPPGADPGKRLLETVRTQPKPEKESPATRMAFYLRNAARKPLEWVAPLAQFVARPVPGSFREMWLRFSEALFHPALFVCGAAAVLGGLATFFAMENNPLKGAMDRQVLIGLGKVIMAIVVPLMTATLFAARVGAGAAARLGNIRLNRQDDALRMLGADPGAYLITPLFWSCLLGLPLLAIPACVASAFASLFCVTMTRPITSFGWAQAFFNEVTLSDAYFGLIKLAGSGVLVAAAAAYLGMKPKSGAEDLGTDVTGTIVAGTFLVILWHGAWTVIQFG